MTGTSYTATANLAGSIAYTSPTQGTVTGTLTGSITSGSDSGEAFNVNVDDIVQTNNILSGSVDVTAPASPTNLTGVADLATGSTFDTSQFTATNTNINWATSSSTGQWSGIVSSTNTTPFGVTLARPTWDSSADTQIDFSFTVTGNWDPSRFLRLRQSRDRCQCLLGEHPHPEDGLIGTVPVYWNQASGTASIEGISPSSIPSGANYH